MIAPTRIQSSILFWLKALARAQQRETYNNLIAKDVPLRMIKVRIVSFDLNKFLVEERKFETFL